ncbi:MAG: flagellar biosynthesis protein FliQ [Planctomycetes bacterium]|nr:flagellar biosynthesis protein FliQ [Planctomycetota bacterium]
MDPQDAVDLGRQAMLTGLLIGAPVLLVGMAVGLGVGLLQALTQIQDQTISFVFKIVAMLVTLAVTLPWLLQTMMDYSEELITSIPATILGG